MSIIKEKLDIFNLLRYTILNERMHKKLNCELEEILISVECSKNLTKFKKLGKI